MNNEEFLATFKAKVLEVLKYSISFFDKHQLNWFIACGSAIGAVRHKGFIPWDDDIDIYMPRKDYEKLISVKEEMLKDGYRFLCRDDEGYPLAFGKIMDNNTTLWSKRRLPINFGIYIDIFPLELADYGMMSFGNKWVPYRTLLFQYRAKIAKVTPACIMDDIRNRKFDNTRVLLAKLPLAFVKRERIVKKMMDLEKKWNVEGGDRYVSYSEAGMYMFPKKWFDEYVMMPFEDIEVRVPKYYHEYLTYMYGDYMTPPPEEERVADGPHGKLYVNFDENIPIKKVRKLI